MKKFYLALAGFAMIASASAQTILNEDFETGNTGNQLRPVAPGWTTIDSYTGAKTDYTWHNYYSAISDESPNPTISGNCCAAVDGPKFTSDDEGKGPREEILFTPELNLNDTYQLRFTFRVSPMNAYDQSRYDLQVRIVENDNLAGAETVFSIQNQKMMKDAGITTYPIGDWNPYTAKIDLSDFKGSKVKIAFVYKMMAETANVAWLDDVSVAQFTPPSGPVAALSADRYNFGNMYVGERIYSDVLTLTNTGKDGLKITGVDKPDNVTLTFNPQEVDLGTYDRLQFQIAYEATMSSPASGQVVFHTNGGDVAVQISATKQLVPEGYTLETFNDYFPPAGWTNNGWNWTNSAIEGEHSAQASGDYRATTLRSPKIDLTEGGKVYFTYYNYYGGDTAPEYDITMQVSYDGGDNWTTKWTSDWRNGLNTILSEEIDLGYGDDNCYVRWFYPAVESDDYGAYEHSTFTLDRVLLPHVAGADGVPGRATVISPANGATDVYPRDLEFKWGPAQFAKGYKLYVGTNTDANDLVDGLDVGKALTYTIPECRYETKYYWKVVGYNDKGDATGVPRWTFTTQPDASISTYPYEENFEAKELPTGWVCTPSATYSRTWSVNQIYPYTLDDKSYNVLSSMWLVPNDSNAVVTPEFLLPDDRTMHISFIWGDGHPSDMVVDPTGMTQKNNAEPNNGISYTEFEILADGTWTKLSYISEPPTADDKKFWINEMIDLSPYKGKKVQFRWKHVSLSNRDDGSSLTHIVIDENSAGAANFNLSSWKAGKVNYEKAVNSGDIFTIFNRGTEDLKITEVKFETPNFTSSLKAGDVIAVRDAKAFNLQFNAGQTAAAVDDKMTVNFDGGYSITLPVSGQALPKGTYYYSFEPNPLDYDWETDFTMIDVDKGANYHFSTYWIYYSADGIRGAFSAENDSKEHGMYGMMNPVSGLWALVASCPQNGSADNWIISKALKIGDTSGFDFYARNWETLSSVLPAPNHHVSVLVTEKLDDPAPADFIDVMRDTEIPLLETGAWKHYDVDLSQYSGKTVKVALRHTTKGISNLAFFDDFRFRDVDEGIGGVETVETEIDAETRVEVFSISGVKVAEGFGRGVFDSLSRGFYVVRTFSKSGIRSFTIALK